MRCDLRYVFWAVLCVAVSFALANDANSVVGSLGLVEVLGYGAIVGLSIAVATGSNAKFRLFARIALGACWMVLATGFFFVIFRPVSVITNLELMLLGLVFGSIAPIVCIGRGIVYTRQNASGKEGFAKR